jgi:hypothetical protein
VCIAFANNNLNLDVSKNGLIAEIHNPANVWVAHTEYTIVDKNLDDRLSATYCGHRFRKFSRLRVIGSKN